MEEEELEREEISDVGTFCRLLSSAACLRRRLFFFLLNLPKRVPNPLKKRGGD
jgi:hypothetical protein